MNRSSFFLVMFWMVCGSLSLTGCMGSKLLYCTSNGIMTYDRREGRFEVLWENSAKPSEVVHDTVYVKCDSLSCECKGE